jgi:hypothetical protein
LHAQRDKEECAAEDDHRQTDRLEPAGELEAGQFGEKPAERRIPGRRIAQWDRRRKRNQA